MSMLILPTLLVIHNILVYLEIQDMLGFLEVFDGYLEYFRDEECIGKVSNYIIRNNRYWFYLDKKQITAKKFIKTFPKIFYDFINNRHFASMITQETKTFDFAGKFMNDKNFIKENLTSYGLYKSIPKKIKDTGITEYFLKKCGYDNFGIIPKKFKILKKIFLPALRYYGLQIMNEIPNNEHFKDRKFIIDLINNFGNYGGETELLKDKLFHFRDDEELVRKLVIDNRQYQELNFASKRLYEKFKSKIPPDNFFDEYTIISVEELERNRPEEYWFNGCKKCEGYGHKCRNCLRDEYSGWA